MNERQQKLRRLCRGLCMQLVVVYDLLLLCNCLYGILINIAIFIHTLTMLGVPMLTKCYSTKTSTQLANSQTASMCVYLNIVGSVCGTRRRNALCIYNGTHSNTHWMRKRIRDFSLFMMKENIIHFRLCSIWIMHDSSSHTVSI